MYALYLFFVMEQHSQECIDYLLPCRFSTLQHQNQLSLVIRLSSSVYSMASNLDEPSPFCIVTCSKLIFFSAKTKLNCIKNHFNWFWDALHPYTHKQLRNLNDSLLWELSNRKYPQLLLIWLTVAWKVPVDIVHILFF